MTALAYAVCSFTANAEERIADKSNIDQIIAWAADGVTTKITFPAGVYEFSNRLTIGNDDLVLEGVDKNSVILKLTQARPALINALGDNASISNLTLDGNNLQNSFGQPIFNFNRSEGHSFDNVIFKNSLQFGISAPIGWATEGLTVLNSEFVDIKGIVINVMNRNTLRRGGDVVTEIKPVTVKSSIFREGYKNGFTLDAGNDRRHDSTDEDGNRIGRRYTESVDMNGSIVQDNIFEKSNTFQLAGVQAGNLTIANNTFMGITDDPTGGANGLHFEQFTHDLKIYDNEFFMPDTIPSAVPYILISATEGHKRVTQEQDSATYPTWTFKVDGSNERRASTACASIGHLDKDCKRDVHAYGPRNIYIAGNTFHASTKINDYLSIKEGENIHIGAKEDGTIALNTFHGGTESSRKVTLSGQDEGNCDLVIHPGQNVSVGNVVIKSVSFDSPPCLDEKPLIIDGTVIGGDSNSGGDDDSDFDGDGILDVNDPDDDNDGIIDEEDAFPFNIKYAAPATEFRFDVIADADVDSSRPDVNLGVPSALKLFVDRRHSYVKFDVAGVEDVLGDTVTQKLWLTNRTAKPVVGNVNVYQTDSDWEESTVTWTNKHDLENLIGSAAVDSTTTVFSVDIDVTTDGYYSFGVNADADGQLYAKESDNGLFGAYIEVVKAVPSPDFDQDGLPDLVDTDDDNDGVDDAFDSFPFDAHESADFDKDGLGDNADEDDDNDNVIDTEDAFPYDPTESLDTDLDGLGNNTDPDDDNDGVSDENDFLPLDADIGVLGDLDGDLDVDAMDIRAFNRGLSAGTITHLAYDLNSDGVVNRRDTRGLVALCTNSRCGVK